MNDVNYSLRQPVAPNQTSQSESISIGKPFTIGHGFITAVVIIGSILRFTRLDSLPLNPAEAATAWSVWRFWQPGLADLTLNSPAYFTFTSLLSQVAIFSDNMVRFWPAIWGTTIILLPWLFRRQIGTIGALITALLLAISPLQTITARTVGGDALALAALLLIAISLLDKEQPLLGLYGIWGGLALGLASSPLFYSGLTTMLFAWVLQRTIGPSFLYLRERWQAVGSQRRRQTAVFAAALFLLSSTFFFWYPAGLGAAANLPVEWLRQFSLPGFNAATVSPYLTMGRYEPAILLLGLPAVMWVSWVGEERPTFLMYWFIGTLLLMLFQSEYQANALLATLPAYLLIGFWANKILSNEYLHWLSGAVGGWILFIMLAILVQIARFSRINVYDPNDYANLAMAVFFVLVTLLFLSYIAAWRVTAVTHGVFLGLLGFCLFFQWGTGWWLAQRAANDPRERWVIAGTDEEVRLLANTAQGISRQVTGADNDIDIITTLSSPALGWYLRDFPRLQIYESLPVNTRASLIITPDQANLTVGDDYAGADFTLLRQQLPDQNTGTWTDSLRWWLFQETTAVSDDTRLILWWRTSLQNE